MANPARYSIHYRAANLDDLALNATMREALRHATDASEILGLVGLEGWTF
jgi:hypothetical protein